METILFKKESKLSNYYECPVKYSGMKFGSSEAAYQSQKVKDFDIQRKFMRLTPDQSKKMARKLKESWREDWDTHKLECMYWIVRNKMLQNKECLDELLSTGDKELIEDTTGWHDNVWGSCYCDKCKNKEHQNNLGKTLMRLRDELR